LNACVWKYKYKCKCKCQYNCSMQPHAARFLIMLTHALSWCNSRCHYQNTVYP
jgi:hypothetical protein